MYQSVNPASGENIRNFPTWSVQQIADALQQNRDIASKWAVLPLAERAKYLHNLAAELEANKNKYATLITSEMGKLISESRAEIEKCALVCRFYAEQGASFLKNESIESDATNSYVCYQPLGTVLAVMPWNFPFWQVFRFLAPALLAGNCGLLKHASNVPQCAMAIEEIVQAAQIPAGVFTNMLIDAEQVAQLIADPQIAAVTFTGSEPAGKKVAATAGLHLKKTVLELGGSDPFIVLEDADLDLTIAAAMSSRYLNCGQSCIAAKRFIVLNTIADEFVQRLKNSVQQLQAGDPMDDSTGIAPMARGDLRDELHRQISDSIQQGAVAACGCQPLDRPGFYYAASILDQVTAKTRVFVEEVFGPVALIIRVASAQEAIAVANGSRFGLGSSVWSTDSARAEAMGLQIQSGSTFINGMVKSDPRLPFGGIKASGYGRELSRHGILEFVNAKTVWIK